MFSMVVSVPLQRKSCDAMLGFWIALHLGFSCVFAAPIVNGFRKPIEPKQGAFPFQASLMQLLSDKKSYHSFCGGSLIHPRWVLTAAHCIQLEENSPAAKPEDVYVALGSVYRSAEGAQVLRTSQLTIHPSYLKTGGRSDIGLVKLKEAAKLGKFVKLVRLHIDNKEPLNGKTAYLTGFGIINDFYETPDRLRKAVLHISSYNKCFSDREYAAQEVCATSTVEEGKACKGDSGGPLTIVKNKKYQQIGITSHLAILPFCQIGFNHSVYTRVSAFIAWISKTTGIDFTKYNRS